MTLLFRVGGMVVALLSACVPALASSHAMAIDRMMATLASQSARDAAAIKRLYRPYLDLLLLNGHQDLAGALANAGLAPLPERPERFNLLPRLDGPHPIGEKDLANQLDYVAARPATIGALIVVASRVRSGPVEITSLVRHAEYQAVLKTTNGNATTSVPMHTMGLAFDIALINAPIERVREVRRVLMEMRAAGDILVVGERQQLVFHVVPHPSRLGYFTDIYAQAVGAVSGTQVVEVIAPGPPRLAPLRPTPRVITDIVAVAPVTEERGAPAPLLTPPSSPEGIADVGVKSATAPLLAGVLFRGVLAFLAALGASAWQIVTRSRSPSLTSSLCGRGSSLA